MAEKKPTPEELEEMRKREARKDKLHQNYLKRKANGGQHRAEGYGKAMFHHKATERRFGR